jgi:hypothetical protein
MRGKLSGLNALIVQLIIVTHLLEEIKVNEVSPFCAFYI